MAHPLENSIPALRRLARGLLHDRDGADDVVQDAWLAALRTPGANVHGRLLAADGTARAGEPIIARPVETAAKSPTLRTTMEVTLELESRD